MQQEQPAEAATNSDTAAEQMSAFTVGAAAEEGEQQQQQQFEMGSSSRNNSRMSSGRSSRRGSGNCSQDEDEVFYSDHEAADVVQQQQHELQQQQQQQQKEGQACEPADVGTPQQQQQAGASNSNDSSSPAPHKGATNGVPAAAAPDTAAAAMEATETGTAAASIVAEFAAACDESDEEGAISDEEEAEALPDSGPEAAAAAAVAAAAATGHSSRCVVELRNAPLSFDVSAAEAALKRRLGPQLLRVSTAAVTARGGDTLLLSLTFRCHLAAAAAAAALNGRKVCHRVLRAAVAGPPAAGRSREASRSAVAVESGFMGQSDATPLSPSAVGASRAAGGVKAVLRPRLGAGGGGPGGPAAAGPSAAAAAPPPPPGGSFAAGPPHGRVCLTPRPGDARGPPPGALAEGRASATVETRRRLPRVSNWTESQTVEEQMKDFEQLYSRFNHTVRYVLLSNIPHHLRDKQALLAWHRRLVDSPAEVLIELIKPQQQEQQQEQQKHEEAVAAEKPGEADGGTAADAAVAVAAAAKGNGEEAAAAETAAVAETAAATEAAAETADATETNAAAEPVAAPEPAAEEIDAAADNAAASDGAPKASGHEASQEEVAAGGGAAGATPPPPPPSAKFEGWVAHLTYKTKHACVGALRKLQQNTDGIVAEHAGPRRANDVLWIGNCRDLKPKDVPEMRRLFECFGVITRFQFLVDKGCGFVHFMETHEAVEARNHLHGYVVGGVSLNVDFSPYTQSPSDKKDMGDRDRHRALSPSPLRHLHQRGGKRPRLHQLLQQQPQHQHGNGPPIHGPHPMHMRGSAVGGGPYGGPGGPPVLFMRPGGPPGERGLSFVGPGGPPGAIPMRRGILASPGGPPVLRAGAGGPPMTGRGGPPTLARGGPPPLAARGGHGPPPPLLIQHRDRLERPMRYPDEGPLRYPAEGPPHRTMHPPEFGPAGIIPYEGSPGPRGEGWIRRGPPPPHLLTRRGLPHPEVMGGPYGGGLPEGRRERDRERDRRGHESSPARGRERRDAAGTSSSSSAISSDLLSLLRERLLSGAGKAEERAGDSRRSSAAAAAAAAADKESSGKDPLLQLLHSEPKLLDAMLIDIARERLQKLGRQPKGGPSEGGLQSRSASGSPSRGLERGASEKGHLRSSRRSRSPTRGERRRRSRRHRRSSSSSSSRVSVASHRGDAGTAAEDRLQQQQPHRAGRGGRGSSPCVRSSSLSRRGDSRADPREARDSWGEPRDTRDTWRDSKKRRMGPTDDSAERRSPVGRGPSPGRRGPGGASGVGGPPAWGPGAPGGSEPFVERHRSSPPRDRGERDMLVCRVSKQGQHVCSMSAKLVIGDPDLQPPSRLDVNQRANLERLQSHLRRGAPGRSREGDSPVAPGVSAARYSVWQMGADSRADSRQYDELCDYFIEKQRVGLLEGSTTTIYMVPPNPKYIHPLGLPDPNFMYAFVIAKARDTRDARGDQFWPGSPSAAAAATADR